MEQSWIKWPKVKKEDFVTEVKIGIQFSVFWNTVLINYALAWNHFEKEKDY